MAGNQSSSYTPDPNDRIICLSCGVALVPRQVNLSYMNGSFHAELLCCPECGFTYIPEDLALGKMLSVEKALEDK